MGRERHPRRGAARSWGWRRPRGGFDMRDACLHAADRAGRRRGHALGDQIPQWAFRRSGRRALLRARRRPLHARADNSPVARNDPASVRGVPPDTWFAHPRRAGPRRGDECDGAGEPPLQSRVLSPRCSIQDSRTTRATRSRAGRCRAALGECCRSACAGAQRLQSRPPPECGCGSERRRLAGSSRSSSIALPSKGQTRPVRPTCCGSPLESKTSRTSGAISTRR